MSEINTSKEKNIYWKTRENAGITRETASDMMGFVSTDRIERVEYNKSEPHPEEVLAMSKCYNKPSLCNYYCSHDCPIGQVYIPEAGEKSISEITVELLNATNVLASQKDRFLQIVVDGQISDDELKDFNNFKEQLIILRSTIESLQLWSEQIDVKISK